MILLIHLIKEQAYTPKRLITKTSLHHYSEHLKIGKNQVSIYLETVKQYVVYLYDPIYKCLPPRMS